MGTELEKMMRDDTCELLSEVLERLRCQT